VPLTRELRALVDETVNDYAIVIGSRALGSSRKGQVHRRCDARALIALRDDLVKLKSTIAGHRAARQAQKTAVLRLRADMRVECRIDVFAG
jgi:hypothetical protein